MRGPITPDTQVFEPDKVDIRAPIPTKLCDRFSYHAHIASRVLHILHLESQIGHVRIGTVQRPRLGSRMTH